MQKIRTGDEVQIVSGGDRPQTAEDKAKPSGRVIAVDAARGVCKVEGRKLVWKHKKGTGPENPGGRSQQEAWIPLANVMVFNKTAGRPEKVAFKMMDGKRVRVFKKSGTGVDAK
jgi:large subunit ribosomal protein L24